ncbi:hypothetical protein B0T17DRAFT_646400 [Bombardia bombarda]|uniref:histidine kinase n=1 Tax=Bombardia bombarda TaxID=252184 RepID=A0AA40BVE9_9PEZI|nr:hypothetical protein B0T17DRAFT_646400 [Bombardia bombarda]
MAAATTMPIPIPAPVSETARERETFTFDDLGISTAALRSPTSSRHRLIPTSVLSSTPDPALTAFAQLGLYRLNVTHSIVSLFDRTHQHFVAEAVRCAPLCNEGQPGVEGQLVFCGTAIPRSKSICEHVLTGPADKAAVPGTSHGFGPDSLPVSVIPNLDLDPRFCYVRDKNRRFYAGVPIRSPTGINIGVYCVLDNKPRPEGLTDDQIQFMRDISKTMMDHLQAKRSNEWYRREERMVRGLGSFVEGQATISNWSRSSDESSFRDILGVQEGALNKTLQVSLGNNGKSSHMTARHKVISKQRLGSNDSSDSSSTSRATDITTCRVAPVDQLQNDVDRVFSKAANIIRESVEVEGVLFLDASVRSFGGMIGKELFEPPILERAYSGESSSDESQPPDGPASSTEPPTCNVLGFSTSSSSSINGHRPLDEHTTMPERLLQKLLQRYPHGRIFDFEKDGLVAEHSGSEIDGSCSPISPMFNGNGNTNVFEAETKPKDNPRRQRNYHDISSSLLKMFPGARSVAFVPLFDGQKNRWFAGGFAWTKTPTRIFTVENELSYLRVFGLATMAEVGRLNTKAADKTKTDILGSISHELRSPLHGVVSTAEILRSTTLNRTQENMLHTIETSGRTLLDTIDHLLDYSKVSNLARVAKADRNKPNSLRSRGKSPRVTTLRTPQLHVQLDRLAEEVVESVLAGWSYRNMSDAHFAAWHCFMQGSQKNSDTPLTMQPSKDSQTESTHPVRIYLDIGPSANWSFQIHPGAFRRIVMNLLGNSLKFTRKGFIRVTLRQEADPTGSSGAEPRVVLTVSDSGKGISQNYLRHHLFTPFSQEDHFAPGTGLGLSLVRAMTVTLGGNIDVNSRVGHGTTVTVSMPLLRGVGIDEDEAIFQQHIQSLAGCRVYLHGFDSGKKIREGFWKEDAKQKSEIKLMQELCHGWLHMNVVPEGKAQVVNEMDFYICLTDDLSKVDNDEMPNLSACPHLFICRDSASTYSLAKPSSSSSHVEYSYLAQPFGPRKLANALLTCRLHWKEVVSAMAELAETTKSEHTKSSEPSAPPASWLSNAQPDPAGAPDASKSTPSGKTQPKKFPVLSAKIVLPAQGEPQTHIATDLVSPPLIATPGVLQAADVLAAAAAEKPTHSAPNHDSSRPSILIVDDNLINLKILAAYMAKLDHPHTMAMNGQEAVEMYTKAPDKYDCILTDISMPVMDGLESTRRIRKFEQEHRLKPVVVIALTGLSGEDIQQDAFVSGVDLFLTRPLVLKGLVEALELAGVREAEKNSKGVE